VAALDALAQDPGTRRIVLISKPPSPAVARKVLERAKQSGKPFVACFLGSSEPGVAKTLTEAAERATERKLPLENFSLKKRPGTLRGLFCGGTLCTEAKLIVGSRKGDVFLDLGDGEYTRGKPHPMIEPELRNAHVAEAVKDPAVGMLLFDVVLGYGSHENPAGVLAANDFKGRTVIASVTGTEQDPQGWSRQAAILRAAGIVVASSNARAAELAANASG
jgi:FdrA protein